MKETLYLGRRIPQQRNLQVGMASIASDSEQSNQDGSAESHAEENGTSHDEESVSEIIRVGSQAGSDKAGTRSSSALFVSEDSEKGQTATNDVIAVKVPKVRQRWQYREFPEESTVQRILRELGTVESQVTYAVTFDDGHEEVVSRPCQSSHYLDRLSRALYTHNLELLMPAVRLNLHLSS